MADLVSNLSDDLPEAMVEAAATWFARLQEPLDSDQERVDRKLAFENWLAEDPRHQQAYAEMQSLWRALKMPVADIMAQDATAKQNGAIHPLSARPSTPARQPVREAGAARALLAACVALFLFAGVVYQSDLLIRLQSDYVTAAGDRQGIQLTDGSTVTLNTKTAISVDFTDDRRLVHLVRGEAWFDVASNPDRPFVVETGSGRIRVTGTSFGVKLQGSEAVVSLSEGEVQLFADTWSENQIPDQMLSPGLQARLTKEGVSHPLAFDESTVTAWLSGRLVFYNTELGHVVEELNRYRSGRIFILNDELRDLRVSGAFLTDDPNAAVSAIADTLPVTVTRLTDQLVFLR